MSLAQMFFGSPAPTVPDDAERQFQALKRAMSSAIDRLTAGERLQLHMEMEALAAKIIANRPTSDAGPRNAGSSCLGSDSPAA